MPAGTVVEFDEAAGVGAVESDDGHRLFFHCTQIADGSRTIDVGAVVTFDVVAGGTGTLSYQWQRNGVNIAGATTTSYTLASAAGLLAAASVSPRSRAAPRAANIDAAFLNW